MGEVAGGTKAEQRRETLFQSAQRWRERQTFREGPLAKIERKGIGAAETPKRQAEYALSKTIKAVAKPFRSIGGQFDLTLHMVPMASMQAMQTAEPVPHIVRPRTGTRVGQCRHLRQLRRAIRH